MNIKFKVERDGIEIDDVTRSSCSRFKVDPYNTYGEGITNQTTVIVMLEDVPVRLLVYDYNQLLKAIGEKADAKRLLDSLAEEKQMQEDQTEIRKAFLNFVPDNLDRDELYSLGTQVGWLNACDTEEIDLDADAIEYFKIALKRFKEQGSISFEDIRDVARELADTEDFLDYFEPEEMDNFHFDAGYYTGMMQCGAEPETDDLVRYNELLSWRAKLLKGAMEVGLGQ